MARGNPKLIALLGLAAVAGYQHRDRIAEMLANARQAQGGGSTGLGGTGAPGGGLLGEIGALFGPNQGGGTVSGGLGELLNRFQGAGRGDAAQSWVSDQPNQPVQPEDMEQAIGDDLLAELQERTGLSRADLVERLATALPDTVNGLTPQGRVPSEDEAEEFLSSAEGLQLREPPRA